jgi:hypothetical protein
MADPEEPLESRSASWSSLKGTDVASLDMGPICAVVVLLLVSVAAMTVVVRAWKEQPQEQARGIRFTPTANPPQLQQRPAAEPGKEQAWTPPLRT